jgi:hypothetical protein
VSGQTPATFHCGCATALIFLRARLIPLLPLLKILINSLQFHLLLDSTSVFFFLFVAFTVGYVVACCCLVLWVSVFLLGIRTSASALARGRLAGAQEVWTIVVHLGIFLFVFLV